MIVMDFSMVKISSAMPYSRYLVIYLDSLDLGS